MRRLSASADLQLSVGQLPKGVKSPATVRVIIGVDESGQPTSCAAEPWPGIPEANAVLEPVACEEMLRSYKAIPASDENGKAVRSVQEASVSFTKHK
jgi:hypothetical protein